VTPAPELLELYRQMVRIRQFELRTAELYRDAIVPGFVHLSVGQEAVAVGVCSQLRTDDVITSTHRGHGHVMAKGLDMTGMFAELMGRATGICGGFGGSMHIADPGLGVFGANGIVGAGLPIAGGAALAASMAATDAVAVAFFGDGAVATGAFHEAVNLAALWHLPLLLVCENNGFSEFSRTSDQHPVSMSERARGYGIAHESVDGNDVQAVARSAAQFLERLRRGEGPFLLEAVTERVHGHYEGDQQRYRSPDDPPVADPIERFAAVLLSGGQGQDDIDAIDGAVRAEVELAAATAQDAPWPAVERIRELGDVAHLVASYNAASDTTAAAASASRAAAAPVADGRPLPELRGSQAVRLALDDALAEDDRVFVAGIDVGAGGGVFGITKGLAAKYPGRLLDTPISETAIMGLGVGAAMAGRRPVVELMYLDFVGVCLDQLMNQAAKLSFMTGGATEVSMVVRTQFGVGRSSGSQHSQSLEILLAHIPGLVVLMPATVADMYGLLRSAIELPGPVVVIENRMLYEIKGPAPPPGHRTPIGQAEVARAGTDVTIVTVSRARYLGLEAAELAAADGISCEVIDLRTIAPLDVDTVLASLARTGRLITVTEASGDFGVGAELAARAVDAGFWSLDAPVRRVSGRPTPVPYSPPLERAWLPSVEGLLAEIHSICSDR
jgi:2-oxoisovalerate dehydrogenase E1 component